jgi:Protein of unknown function (DUF3175)
MSARFSSSSDGVIRLAAKSKKRKSEIKRARARKAPGKGAHNKGAHNKGAHNKGAHKWSGAVTQRSDALDLEPSVFKSTSAAGIARSLKRSAESSTRRKGTPFQSAMSMLNFYINRGGANLSARRKGVLQRAKGELRRVFHREA